MVKREKSPVIRDDAKYLVVYQPYPLNADFDLPGDYIAFAFWVAVVLGSYEPARSTVIVEVDRQLNLDNLLGEHRWENILKKPKKDEKRWISRVFFSIYKTTREAGKDGWKRIQVEPEWFTDRGWNLTDGPFKHPYPDSDWCKPLAEDPTGKPIARPLPIGIKPPPPNAPSFVPGSVEWVEATSGSGGPSPGTPSSASGNGVTQSYVPSISTSLVFKVYRVRDEAPRAISVPTTCHLAWDDEEDQHRSSCFSSYSRFSFCFSFTCFPEDSKFSSESCERNLPILG
ncbi:hypothetical protein EST38_g13210 [Candolleomyces aberdarensis]|uniref:Uncharacterized protein n=1 Tax=Candolleomyces aberdarensis TaxID=2316362 RepID=A0A4Q2D0H3_9AGAR|nr:hypothetical protein EST38_g13210 [Candolleomyces aberdarensis]